MHFAWFVLRELALDAKLHPGGEQFTIQTQSEQNIPTVNELRRRNGAEISAFAARKA
jgi:hypothetical protein